MNRRLALAAIGGAAVALAAVGCLAMSSTDDVTAPTPAPVQTSEPAPLPTVEPTPTATPTTSPTPVTVNEPTPTPTPTIGTAEPAPDPQQAINDLNELYPTFQVGPCLTEDDSNCYWDATVRGNGKGHSFVNIDGRYYYAEDGR